MFLWYTMRIFIISHSMWQAIIHRLAIQFFFDVLYFPVWWYTNGLKRVAVGCGYAIEEANINFAPGLWLKYIFVPMYGQHDIQGRIMSIFIRIVNIIIRGFALGVFIFFAFAVLLAWIFFPVFVIYMTGLSLFG